MLKDGGQSWSDVVSLRLCIKHTGDTGAAAALLDDVADTLCEIIPAPRPAATDTGAVQLRGTKRDELWITPDTRECSSPPPSSSAVTTSPVAAFTSGGPPRKMLP